jgi:hypothetical protein
LIGNAPRVFRRKTVPETTVVALALGEAALRLEKSGEKLAIADDRAKRKLIDHSQQIIENLATVAGRTSV